MRIATVSLVAAALALALPVAARADCAFDLQNFKPKLDHVTDKAKRGAVMKEYNKAVKAQPDDEVACLNYLTRARRALNAEPAAPKPKVVYPQVNYP